MNYVVMGKKLYAGDPSAAVAFVPSFSGLPSSAGVGPAHPLGKERAEKRDNAREEAEDSPAVARQRAQHQAERQQNFEALLQAMAPVEHPPGPRTVTLPFPDADGNLRTVEVGPSADGKVALPFPGPDGQLRRVLLDPALRHVPPPAFTGVLPIGPPLQPTPEPVRYPKN